MSLIPKLKALVLSSLNDSWFALLGWAASLGLPVSANPIAPAGGLKLPTWVSLKISLCVFGIGFLIWALTFSVGGYGGPW